MALIPTKKIPQLTAYGAPLQGTELLEIWAVNTSRRVTARDFVLPIDSLLTVADQGSVIPGSRQVIAGIGIAFVDGGAGSTLSINSTGAVAGPADPTAQVGLAPVNGAALTYMRSDAAPPLDQAIIPTWTGLHTFTAGANSAGDSFPFFRITETDAAANNRVWEWAANAEQFVGRMGDDALGAYTDWVTVDRTNLTVDLIGFFSTAFEWNGSAILTEATAFANPSAQVGLIAVNGVAVTAMRSDAAPSLDQGISPTWTANHTWANVSPALQLFESDAAGGNRAWRLAVDSEQFGIYAADDTFGASSPAVVIDRTLNTIDSFAITSTALTWNGSPLLSTATAFANPTASVGLAAVNGAATTAMRSDAAPALSQSISPSWTAHHSFTKAFTGVNLAGYPVALTSAEPALAFNETDAAANNRLWDIYVNAETFRVRVVNDAVSAASEFLRVDRTGTTVDQIALSATAVNVSTAANGAFGVGGAASGVYGALRTSATNFNPLAFIADGQASGSRSWGFRIGGAADFQLYAGDDTGAPVNPVFSVTRSGTTVDTMNVSVLSLQYNGVEVGYRGLPFTGSDSGSRVNIQAENGGLSNYNGAGGHTWSFGNLSAGTRIVVSNGGTGTLTITSTSGGLSWFNGAGSIGSGNRTLAVGGICTLARVSGVWWIWGFGLS